MKQATVVLKLTRDNWTHVHNVTPIEALLLVAEHHKNSGGEPLVVEKDTIKDTPDKDRTEDQEISRLRGKYHISKIDAILTKVRNLPKDYDEAIKKGSELVLPTNPLSEATLAKK